MNKLCRKKEPYKWTDECTNAFDRLKAALVSPPILAYASPDGEFVLDTDASNYGISGILSQVQEGKERVIGYFSRSLSKEERRYCVTRRELLAIVKSVDHYHHYLYGLESFTVRTDHGSLRWLMRFKNPEDQMARWLTKLGMYNMKIEFRPGRFNSNADGLSRIPCGPCKGCTKKCDVEEKAGNPVLSENSDVSVQKFRNVSAEPQGPQVQRPTWMPDISREEMREAQLKDPDLALLLAAKEGSQPCPEKEVMDTMSQAAKKYSKQWERLEVQDGVLYRRWFDANTSKLQLIVPFCFRHLLLKGLHDDVCAGHLGRTRTQARVSAKYYWYGYQQDVEDWCRRCEKCQKRRIPKKPGRTRMKPSKVGHRNQKVALDLLGPLPVSNRGNKWILLIADYFSKWPVAVPLPNAEARTVAQGFVDNFVSIFGVPEQLHSDQGRQFESHFFAELCSILDISKSRTSPYWAQSDGLVERMNSVVEAMISKYVSANQKDWDEKLQLLMLAYRSSVHSTTGYSPNMMVFGSEPNLPVDLILGQLGPEPENGDPMELRETLRDIHNLAREHVHFSQQVQERGYNKRINDHCYKPGDKVWLRETRRYKGLSPKLSAKFVGPFVVKEVITNQLFRICRAGPGSKVQVVHHDRLKPYEGRNQVEANTGNPEPQPVLTTGAQDESDYMPEIEEDVIAGDALVASTSRRKRVIRTPVWYRDYVK